MPDRGRQATGVDVDHRRRLFVAGGPTGDGYVYDARTGADIASYDFADIGTFVNDVIVTRSAAWFTDSFRPFLYRVAIAPNGRLGSATAVPLTSDIVYGAGFNVNGIDATPNGRTLVIVQSTPASCSRSTETESLTRSTWAEPPSRPGTASSSTARGSTPSATRSI